IYAIPTSNTIIQDFTGLPFQMIFSDIPVYDSNGNLLPDEERPLTHALLQGRPSEVELQIKELDGQMLFLLVSAAPLRDSDGTITSAILVLHEITKIKTLERAREDFFTTMAHELKTPLANIRAHLSALLTNDYLWSAEEQYSFIETADEQVGRLVSMINHFLDASRVEAGALRLEIEPVILPELLEDLQERLEALVASSTRTLEIILAPHLPAVFADYELIISVLTNLLSNAFRYAPKGDRVQLRARSVYTNITQQENAIGVEICVSDRGPGLSAEQQIELFTRFSTFAAKRRPNANRPGQTADARWSPGTGLGLYISRGIIEAHGSFLDVESNPNEGATFRFVLPAAHPRKNEV
ncbi:MAG: PAS domain-containing sensor histidine kinase, partial [Chloroflexota bacterium]|nr:PAS domain-containing sensor histidine kinase [Chloroflexota bacterium]